MIKKTTKIIIDGKETPLKGGMPLSKGEIVHFHQGDETAEYEVVDKRIDYSIEGEDHHVDVTYTLKKSL